MEEEATNNEVPAPKLPKLQDLSDFSDGVGLTAVAALYCPEDLLWSEITLGDPPTMSDSLCNIQLFQRFCSESLPYSICHLSIEDIFYLHSSIKLAISCLLADLFTVLEVKPAKCVQLPGVRKAIIIDLPDPDRVRTPSRSNGTSLPYRPDSRSESTADESFVVQRGKGVPTLTSVSNSHRSLSPSSDLGHKERLNQDTKSEERGETETPSLTRSSSILEQLRNQGAAGRPSDGEASKRSFAGRRSRRNSTQDNESQICIENIGGSTDNLNVIGRNPDKEMRVHTGRRSEPVTVGSLRRGTANTQTFDIRKLADDGTPDNEVKMFIDNKELEAMEKHEREGSPYGGKAAQVVALSNSTEESERKTSFADLRRKSQTQNLFATSGINLSYIQGDEKEDSPKRVYGGLRRQGEETAPSTPARNWGNGEPGATSSPAPGAMPGDEMNDRLNSVRMKLEERRKRIEEEKRKMEVVMSRQREKGGAGAGEQSALGNSWLSERASAQTSSPSHHPPPDQRPPDNYTPNKHMNESLHEMQTDIQKLATQQSQIQKMMQSPKPTPQPHNPMDPQPFYIAGMEQQQQQQQQPLQVVQPSPQRRTWGQPQPINFGGPGMGWSSPMAGPRPPMYGAQPYPPYDQYGNPIVPRDQWGNPLPQQPMYAGGQPPQQVYDQYGQPYPQPYGQQQSPYGMQPNPYGQFAPQPYNSPYQTPNQSPHQPQLPYTGQPQARTPFRLHETPSPGRAYGEPQAGEVASPRQYSRQNSRELVEEAGPEPRRLHTALPAPAAFDMEPQNVSFIENSTDNDEDEKSISPVPKAPSSGETARSDSNLSERLSRLNISRGDKTYRVQLHADGREPTALEQHLSSTRSTTRPTISSTFKERRRGSSEGSGPGSMSGPGSLSHTPTVQSKLSVEEIDALNTMKTEVLRETGDPAKGFVISFDDDSPIKPKPVLKQRRMSKKGSRDEMKSSDPVMIMLDMNEDGDDSESARESSPLRKMSPSHKMNRMNSLEQRLGSPSRYIDASQWNSFGEEGGLKSPDDPVFPKFDIDPSVPLEPMKPLIDNSDSDGSRPMGMIIGDQLLDNAEDLADDMAAKKEKIIMQSLRRKQQAEENRIKREEAARQRKEDEAAKAEETMMKKEEEKRRKEAILEAFKYKKEQDKAEEEGRRFPAPVSAKPVPKIRAGAGGPKKPRPKTMVIDSKDVRAGGLRARGSTSNLSNLGASIGDLRRSESRNSLADQERPGSSRSTLSLATMGSRPPPGQKGTPSYARPLSRATPGSRRGSTANLEDTDSPSRSRPDRTGRSMSQPRGKRDSSVSSAHGVRDRNDSYRGSRESLVSRRTYTARRGSNASLYEDEDDNYYGGSLRDVSYGGHSGRRKSSSTNYLGPGSLPSRRMGGGRLERDYDDGASDMSSQASGWSAYSHGGGQRMYREPSTKSNRPIVMNALEHAVFPGAVNKDTRMRVLDEIDACDCPHFLILFRDSKCQFRGLYAYYPDTDEVFKIYGTGPKQVTENMFEQYFKYNSGGKKFTQIHTKSLTVTIDAFTIHNSLWLGKKTKLPDKRGMALVM